jgi:ribonuclease BN (tRNA processing enzyme)
MRFVPLGVGDAFSSLHYSSALAIEQGGELVLVDCPHPILKMLREAGARAQVDLAPERIAAVILTHLHADHVSGLESLTYHARFVLGRRLRIAAHANVLARLWEHLAPGMDHLVVGGQPRRLGRDDYLDVTPLADQGPVQVGPLAVECRPTLHHIPTTALRLAAGGRRLGYSADTYFDPGLIAWLAEADLIVHETGVGIHTHHEHLAALPAELRARMRLCHYPDGFVPDGAIAPLVEGEPCDV